VPAAFGLDDPRHARVVVLAWLFKQINSEEVGSTRPVFDKIGQATKAVRAWYGRMEPQRGDKTGDAVAYSAAYDRIRLGSIIRLPVRRQRTFDDVVLFRSPDEIVKAVLEEIGDAGGKKGARR
jgi:hypothetical protein